jgi:hypothetical protein
MIEEKIILFQNPNKLGLTKEEILLKFEKNRNLFNLYHDLNSNALVGDDEKVKKRFNNKIVIDNLYKNKINPSNEIEIDLKKDFNEVKKEFKKLFENIYFDIDSSSLKWNIKSKEEKSNDALFNFKKRQLSSIFELPLNYEELSSLTAVEYICMHARIFKPIMNRLIRVFENYSEITNDYSSQPYVNRKSLISTIVNFNLIEKDNSIEEFLEFLGINKTQQEFLRDEFLAICLFSERYFLGTEISNLKIIYEIEENLIENLDFQLIESKEFNCLKNLKNLLFFISKQTNTLYLNSLQNMQTCKKIHFNEYRSSNYIKINQLKK